MSKSGALIVIVAAFLSFHFQVYSQELVDTLDIARVVADRKWEQKRSGTGFVRLEKADLLKGMALFSSPDVIKILQTMPGVAPGMELFSGLYVRGGDGSDNLFYMDGTPLYQVSHLGGLFSSFNSDVVSSLEFYKSGFPARYGGRISSVVDVSTGEPGETFKGKFSIGLLDGRLYLSGPVIKDKLYYEVGVRRSWLDLLTVPGIAVYNRVAGKNFGMNYNFMDMNACLLYKASENDRISFKTYLGRDHLYYNENLEMNLTWGNVASSLSWVHNFSSSFILNNYVYYSNGFSDIHYDMKGEDNPDVGEKMTESNIGDIQTVGASSNGEISAGRHFINFGLDYRHDFYNPKKEASNPALYEEPYYFESRYSTDELSLYAEDKIRFDKFIVELGLRASAVYMSGKLSFFPQPRVNLVFCPTDKFSLKASYSRMIQVQHLVSSLYFDLPSNLWMPSTPSVSPMVSDQIAMGAAYSITPVLRFNADAYYKTMDNMLMYSGAASVFPPIEQWEQSFAVGKGRSYGLETEVEYMAKGFDLSCSYTLSWSERLFAQYYDSWFADRFDNRHKFVIQGTCKVGKHIRLNAMWNYHSGNRISVPEKVYEDENGKYSFLFSSPFNAKLPDYHRLDIGMDISRKTKGGHISTWNISIYNVYCRMNPIGGNFEVEDSGECKVHMISLIPIIPSFSYTLEF